MDRLSRALGGPLRRFQFIRRYGALLSIGPSCRCQEVGSLGIERLLIEWRSPKKRKL